MKKIFKRAVGSHPKSEREILREGSKSVYADEDGAPLVRETGDGNVPSFRNPLLASAIIYFILWALLLIDSIVIVIYVYGVGLCTITHLFNSSSYNHTFRKLLIYPFIWRPLIDPFIWLYQKIKQDGKYNN